LLKPDETMSLSHRPHGYPQTVENLLRRPDTLELAHPGSLTTQWHELQIDLPAAHQPCVIGPVATAAASSLTPESRIQSTRP